MSEILFSFLRREEHSAQSGLPNSVFTNDYIVHSSGRTSAVPFIRYSRRSQIDLLKMKKQRTIGIQRG